MSDRLRIFEEDAMQTSHLAPKVQADKERLWAALAGLDPVVQWIAENYPAVWREMPSEFYRAFTEARAALAATGVDE